MENEVPLSGGRITSGVVRVGNTVRRPATASSSFVAELLGDLKPKGFTGAPRHLGFDRPVGRSSPTFPATCPPDSSGGPIPRWLPPALCSAPSMTPSMTPPVAAAWPVGIPWSATTTRGRTTRSSQTTCRFPSSTSTPLPPAIPSKTSATWRGPGVSPPSLTLRPLPSKPHRYVSSPTRTGSTPPPAPASSMLRSTARPATPSGGAATSRALPHTSPTTTRSPGRVRWSEREYAYTSVNRTTFDAALD